VSGSDRVYSPGRPERTGRVAGLSAPQALVCVLVGMVPVIVFGSGAHRAGLELGLAAVVIVAAVVVPIRGRPAGRWAVDSLAHGWGLVSGWSSWQSKVAAGLPVGDPDEPDLPGVLSRLDWHDGPPFPEHGRPCVVHDTAAGRWAVTAELSARGIGLASPLERRSLARGLGRMLGGLVDSERLDRVSLLVRSVPDDGTAYESWLSRHQVPDPPELVTAVTDDLRRMAGSASVRQEAFVTVSARADALRKSARAAGGGEAGYSRTLYRGMAALTEPLQAMGCDPPAWLSRAGLAAAVRTGFNPGAARLLTQSQLTGEPGLPAAAAGPTRAPSPGARSYAHDGYLTVSYCVIPPKEGVTVGSLAPLLTTTTAGERRSLAIHYEVLGSAAAARIARHERQAATLVSELKTSKGFGSAAKDRQDRGSTYRVEDAVAAGEGMVRYAIVVAVTVPCDWNIEDHAETLETAAAGQYRLLRLELAQDSGFIASTLPLGMALPATRSVL